MKKTKFASVLIGLLFVLCVVFMLSTFLYGAVRFETRGENGYLLWMNLAVLFPFVICFIGRWLYPRIEKRLCQSKTTRTCLNIAFWVVLISAAAGMRLWWVLRVSPPPYSDFEIYYRLADALANGRALYLDYISVFPHVIGLPAVLSVLFRIAGASIWTVHLFQIAVSVLTVILTFFIAKNLMNTRCGKIAAVLLAFYPPSIYFCSLVSTEALHLLLMTFCIFLVTLAIKTQSYKMHCLLFLLLGIMTELGNAIRPVSTLLLVALLFCIVFFMRKTRQTVKRAAGLCSILLISLIVTGQVTGYYIEKTIDRPISKGNIGYNLAVGVNMGSFGAWNVNDSALVSEIQRQSSAKEAHRYMQNLAFERIRENPAGMLGLMPVKTFLVWSDDSAGQWYAQSSYHAADEVYDLALMHRADMAATCYFMFLLSMMAIGLFFLLKNPEYHHNILFVVMILGAVAAFSILEAQSRYRFFLTTANIMIAVYACYVPEREPHADFKGKNKNANI